MTYLTTHFTTEEFKCPCCGIIGVDQAFVELLEKLRVSCGFPFKITSGYRCDVHNQKVGGAKDSAHRKGKAADIAVSGDDAALLLRRAIEMKFTGIGVKQHGERRFIHVDTAHSALTVWSYP
jgi:uncharacterized protein YcbK (DUF882 family)